MIQTSLIGKYCTFPSCEIHTYLPVKQHTNSFSNIYGEIVGMYVGEQREYTFVCGAPKVKARTILVVNLSTFSKDSLVEIPIESVTIHDTVANAEYHCIVE